MAKRYFYSLMMGWKHRKDLGKIMKTTPKNLETKLICPQELHDQGIKVLILDFDGVLASDGKIEPHQEMKTWLHKCIEVFKNNVFILSNKPKAERKHYFELNFPKIHFVHSMRKKPYPDGIEDILNKTHAKPEEAVIIDDRLLTGILAGVITGINTQFIRVPYQNFKERPVSELFFASLRLFESSLARVKYR